LLKVSKVLSDVNWRRPSKALRSGK
jgi:hypothetical protein